MKPDLNRLLQLLLENQIDFVLVGGFAGVLHGSSLVTKDVDICSMLTPEHIEKLRKVLAPLKPKHRMTPQRISFLEEPRTLESIKNLYLETSLGTLDIISSVTGVGDFKRLLDRAIEVPLFGFRCKVISIEDLIAAKKTMGREKDRIAIRELNAIKDRKR
jgi:hypothetical protein